MADKTEKKAQEQPTTEEARAILAAERQRRGEQCRARIEQVLQQHRCVASCRVEVTPDGRLQGRLVIAPLD